MAEKRNGIGGRREGDGDVSLVSSVGVDRPDGEGEITLSISLACARSTYTMQSRSQLESLLDDDLFSFGVSMLLLCGAAVNGTPWSSVFSWWHLTGTSR